MVVLLIPSILILNSKYSFHMVKKILKIIGFVLLLLVASLFAIPIFSR
jgi:hypothetical protein